MREGSVLLIMSEAIVTRRDSSLVTFQASSAYVGRCKGRFKNGA